MTTDKNSAREIAERILQLDNEISPLTKMELAETVARAYLELENRIEHLESIRVLNDSKSKLIEVYRAEIARLEDENERLKNGLSK